MDTKLNQLEQYVKKGWYLYWISPYSKAVKVKGGFHNASNNFEQIKKWHLQNPKDNWLIYPGKSGLCVIDIDAYKKDCNVNAIPLPKTLTCITPNDGFHKYFNKPAGMKIGNSNGNLPKGWDIRCDAGYVVSAPSEIKKDDGTLKAYRWEDESIPIADLPEEIIKRLTREDTPPPVKFVDTRNNEDKLPDVIKCLTVSLQNA